MNSAVMPAPGIYRINRISQLHYTKLVKEAVESGKYSSSIGYSDNVDIIEQLTGYRVPVSREETKIAHGDVLLIMKLKYRTDGYKKRTVKLEDFEYFHCTFAK